MKTTLILETAGTVAYHVGHRGRTSYFHVHWTARATHRIEAEAAEMRFNRRFLH